jgi:acetyl-CoA carboxylase biotin carboxylase subunit
MFDKVLIANRGEIAVRIIRACQELGIKTVAVHSTADADAMHARIADESVCIGPPGSNESYLNIPSIIAAGEITNSDAIHPGYGFLSENEKFASIVEEHGFTFIGPTAEHIRIMGDKAQAKSTMQKCGIPTVPGSDGKLDDSDKNVRNIAESIGYPLLVKAVSGGGGRGMQRIDKAENLLSAIAGAKAESKAAFGDDSVYLEKLIERPRHIEIQIVADTYGNVIHLGERDCSIQRRHQKLLEEAPSPALNSDERKNIGIKVVDAIKSLGYRGVGTIEFLYTENKFYFIEMNTRIQVEHPVTESITGIDLVREQIRIAAGAPLGYSQNDIDFTGHSIECRINAENAEDFTPSPGLVTSYHPPGGPGVRVDSALFQGYVIPPYYDSLISKLIVHGATRNECLMRLRRALDEYVILGVDTTIPFHLNILKNSDIANGTYDIQWLDRKRNSQ